MRPSKQSGAAGSCPRRRSVLLFLEVSDCAYARPGFAGGVSPLFFS